MDAAARVAGGMPVEPLPEPDDSVGFIQVVLVGLIVAVMVALPVAVAVIFEVPAAVGPMVAVLVAFFVAVAVMVAFFVAVAVMIAEVLTVAVNVLVAVALTVGVRVDVWVRVGIGLGTSVGREVGKGVAVGTGVGTGVSVGGSTGRTTVSVPCSRNGVVLVPPVLTKVAEVMVMSETPPDTPLKLKMSSVPSPETPGLASCVAATRNSPGWLTIYTRASPER